MPVVDASVVIDWTAPGAGPSSPSMRTLRALNRRNEAVMAPELLYVECASALVLGESGEIGGQGQTLTPPTQSLWVCLCRQ
jgi:hypothetical protein